MVLLQVSWFVHFERLNSLIEAGGFTAILATIACVYAAYKVFYALYLSPLRNVPGPFLARLTSKRAEYFGAAGAIAHKAVEEYEAYGDTYVYQPNAISISNPSDIRTVLGSAEFPKSDFYKALDILGHQITLSARDIQFASMRRRQIGPFFSNAYLAKMEKAIMTHGIISIKAKWDGLLEQSEDGQVEVNYYRTFLYAAFDTIGSLAFGREFGALKNDDPTVSEWVKGTLVYFGVTTMFPFLSVYPFSLIIAPFARLFHGFLNHAGKCVAARKELLTELEASGDLSKKPTDLLQGFIDAVDEESKAKMSLTEVQAESILMLSAGSDTQSNTLMWTIHLFMLYPLCYKRAVEEVRSAFDRDHLITFKEAKAKLPYIEACVYEALRVVPVTGGQFPRLARKEGVVLSGGYFIPSGTEIYINYSAVNLHKDYWNDPYLFDPTRFLDNEEAKRNVFTFGYGVRVCPGRQLAWIEMLTVLANILKDYDLRHPDDYTICGPNVLDSKGLPKLMERSYHFSNAPKNWIRDCRVVVSKRT